MTGRNVPAGVFSLARDGEVVSFLPADLGAGAPDAASVVGLNLFEDLLGTEATGLKKKFEQFLKNRIPDPYMAANLRVRDGRLAHRLLVGFVRSTLPDEVVVTVARVDHPDLPLTAQVRHDSVHGTLTDTTGLRVVVANPDLWQGLELLLHRDDPSDAEAEMRRFGSRWGLAHAVRVESFVQQKTLRTLRELELEIALEYVSSSLSLIGLGSFEADLEHRRKGVIVLDHHDSPFPTLFATGWERSCAVLAGFHAGLFSYLSGRNVSAYELFCSREPDAWCRFLLGTAERLEDLRAGRQEADRRLIEDLLGEPKGGGE